VRFTSTERYTRYPTVCVEGCQWDLHLPRGILDIQRVEGCQWDLHLPRGILDIQRYVLKVVSEIYIYLEVYSISNVLKVVSEIYIYREVYSISNGMCWRLSVMSFSILEHWVPPQPIKLIYCSLWRWEHTIYFLTYNIVSDIYLQWSQRYITCLWTSNIVLRIEFSKSQVVAMVLW
jgi:hypothetical protein